MRKVINSLVCQTGLLATMVLICFGFNSFYQKSAVSAFQAQTPMPYAASTVLHLPEDTDNSRNSWPQTSITLNAPSICILQDQPVAS